MSLKKKITDGVKNVIRDMRLITEKERVLVAFSGGADSVCLLYILNSLKSEFGFELFAAHLNHGLRGDAADADERFCKSFCEKLGVELFVFKEDVKAYSVSHGISEELAGRELRYSLFEKVMKENEISKLSVAHHADDQAETVLMHLMRGSGIDGLSGMRYMRGNIVRPLLFVTKDEILDFCKEAELEFCTDATNFETVYSRNKVRLELVPKMREFNPSVSKNLVRTADILASEADFLEQITEEMVSDMVFDNSCEISKLLSLHIAVRRRVVRKMLERIRNSKKDLSIDLVDKILALAENSESGKEIIFGKISAKKEYERLIISEKKDKSEGFFVGIKLEESIIKNGFCYKIEKCENGDFDFGENPVLNLRSRRNGDRIYPCGMSGSKKLKDFFIDEKVAREKRDNAVILECNGEIAAVFYDNKHFYDRRFYKHKKGSFNIIVRED